MATPSPTTQVKVDRLDPWKEDGNVVLTAEGKYFRVHRSVLSAYSQIFRDMFDCPPPNVVEEEFIECCPVVHLQDAATDVQVILKAMYDRSYPVPYYDPEKKTPLSVVSAYFHLGEKYAIPMLMEEAKAKLCCDQEISMHTASSITSTSSVELFSTIADSDPHNFQVMNLLQEMGLQAALPITMYRCIITCPLRDIIDGYRVDGSFYSLSSANLRSFMLMKNVLESHRVLRMKSLLTKDSCNRGVCERNKRQLLLEDTDGAPFSQWRHQWDSLLCETCKSSLKARREADMKQTWDEIPKIFDFQSWSQVKIRRVMTLHSITL